MRYLLTIILLTGCADIREEARIQQAKQQLRAAVVFVDDEPLMPNTIALEAIKTKLAEPSESEPAVESEPEVSPQQAPVTPDPAGSDFIQPIPEPSITFQPVVQSSGPLATLYTSDGSFRCGGCEQQERILSTGNIPVDLYQVVLVNGETAAAMGGVPRWEPYDKSRTFGGAMTADKLRAWLDSLQKFRDGSTSLTCVANGAAVTVDTVAAALAVHLSDEAGQQPFGSLLNVDVDTPDEMTAAVFEIFETGKYSSAAAGIAFEWSAETRAISDKAGTITLTPPARITLSKWKARWNATLNGITYDTAGRSVTLILGGAPDLTVMFK